MTDIPNVAVNATFPLTLADHQHLSNLCVLLQQPPEVVVPIALWVLHQLRANAGVKKPQSVPMPFMVGNDRFAATLRKVR